MSPTGKMAKRSSTHLRYDFQPDIMIEPTKVNKNDDEVDKNSQNDENISDSDSISNKQSENEENLFLNINVPAQMKKQKTLSNKGGKSKSKAKIQKKGTTKSSKWNVSNNQSPNHSKTIERKFTLSSSISSIKCLSKKRENQQAQSNSSR